jgi:hypothetical protein
LNPPAPRYLIIVPVLNETASINGILAHLRGLEGQHRADIIVVGGYPEGATLRAIRCDGVQNVLSPPGRGVQMNEGAKNARGELLLFLHADTALPLTCCSSSISESLPLPGDGQPCRHERLGKRGAGVRVLYRLHRGLPG